MPPEVLDYILEFSLFQYSSRCMECAKFFRLSLVGELSSKHVLSSVPLNVLLALSLLLLRKAIGKQWGSTTKHIWWKTRSMGKTSTIHICIARSRSLEGPPGRRTWQFHLRGSRKCWRTRGPLTNPTQSPPLHRQTGLGQCRSIHMAEEFDTPEIERSSSVRVFWSNMCPSEGPVVHL